MSRSRPVQTPGSLACFRTRPCCTVTTDHKQRSLIGRPGRAGLPISEWFVEQAESHDGVNVTVADLAELSLPLLDEPNHPRLRQYLNRHTKDWSAMVDAADAIAIVT